MTSGIAAPGELLRRVVDAMTRRPRCTGCEGYAVQDWQVMPLGGIFGLCGRCARQWRQMERVSTRKEGAH